MGSKRTWHTSKKLQTSQTHSDGQFVLVCGAAYIQKSFGTVVLLIWFSISLCAQGKEGFKNARKGTSVAAQTTATSAAIVSIGFNMHVLCTLGLLIQSLTTSFFLLCRMQLDLIYSV